MITQVKSNEELTKISYEIVEILHNHDCNPAESLKIIKVLEQTCTEIINERGGKIIEIRGEIEND